MSDAPGRPRVLHVATVPQSLAFLRGQVEFVRDAGFDVEAATSGGEMCARFTRETGVRVHQVEMARQISPLRDLKALVGLLRLLVRVRPQILHAHTPKAGLLSMLAGRLLRVPVRVYHVHGLPLDTSVGLKRRILLITERIATGCATRVLAVSPSLAFSLVSRGLCATDRVRVLANGSANGIDASHTFSREVRAAEIRADGLRLAIDPGQPVIGFVGRLVRDKGLLELAEAWRRLRSEHPEAKLLVVGPREDPDGLPAGFWREWEQDERVVMTGWVQDPAPLYGLMSILAFPSHREGFGLAAAEAGAMAVPVVATRVTGLTDVVLEGTTGQLVEAGDPSELADALQQLLMDPGARSHQGASARERVLHNYRPEDVWAAVVELYRKELADAG